MNNVFVDIPVHNRKEFTRDCILSLYSQSLKDFQIVVIDDGSTDGTAEMLRDEFPEIHIINGDGNLWWTRATNLGVRWALESGAHYIMTLNNDTKASVDFVEKMLFWSARTPDSLLGAFAIDVHTGVPTYGGEIINWKSASSKFLLDVLPREQWHGLHEVTHFPGRGLLIPSAVFKKIGLFDEVHFPHYAADYDFTHRAIRVGYKVYCNYDARLYTYPDASGDAELRYRKSLRHYYDHLFSIKGGGNLKRFVTYGRMNCPRKYFLSFLFIGLLRRIFGYLGDWFFQSITKLSSR